MTSCKFWIDTEMCHCLKKTFLADVSSHSPFFRAVNCVDAPTTDFQPCWIEPGLKPVACTGSFQGL